MKKLIKYFILILVCAVLYYFIQKPISDFLFTARFPNVRARYEKLLFGLDRQRSEGLSVPMGMIPKRTGKVLLLNTKAQLLTTIHPDFFRLPDSIRAGSPENPETIVFCRLERISPETHDYQSKIAQLKGAGWALRIFSFDRSSSKFLGAYEVRTFKSDALGNPIIGDPGTSDAYPDMVPIIMKMKLIKK